MFACRAVGDACMPCYKLCMLGLHSSLLARGMSMSNASCCCSGVHCQLPVERTSAMVSADFAVP